MLADAQLRLRSSAVEAAQAEEAFDRARWQFRDARLKARAAERSAHTAAAQLAAMRDQYADVVTSSYEMSPSLTALSAIMHTSGIRTVVERTSAYHNAQLALDLVYDDFDGASLLAGVASHEAADARAAADARRDDTKAARAVARDVQ